MLIERRDVRVLRDGWYEFKVEFVKEVYDGYGAGVQIGVCVASGPSVGSRVYVQTDRVATAANKLGRLIRAAGFDAREVGVFDLECIVGGRFSGRVERYKRSGRWHCKIVEFRACGELGGDDAGN